MEAIAPSSTIHVPASEKAAQERLTRETAAGCNVMLSGSP